MHHELFGVGMAEIWILMPDSKYVCPTLIVQNHNICFCHLRQSQLYVYIWRSSTKKLTVFIACIGGGRLHASLLQLCLGWDPLQLELAWS